MFAATASPAPGALYGAHVLEADPQHCAQFGDCPILLPDGSCSPTKIRAIAVYMAIGIVWMIYDRRRTRAAAGRDL